MSGFQMNSIMAVGRAAEARVASALTTPSPALQTSVTAKAAAASGSAGSAAASASSTGGSTITSADFLTLLVSELKNQDPTQPTDPNAYITQLVGVNSLQQLISINQGLTTIEPSTTSGNGSGATTPISGVTAPVTGVPTPVTESATPVGG